MKNCTELQSYLKTFSLVKECDVIRNGALRIATPFQYPNGSSIDLFMKEVNPASDGWILSDQGQTVAYLLDLHINLSATKKRKSIIADICKSLGTEFNDGQFEIKIAKKDMNDLANRIVLLSQACIRVSDISFTQRLRTTTVFREDMEEFFDAIDLPFESTIPLVGQFNIPVEIDFRVKGKQTTSLIKTLSTGNGTAAHTLSNEILRCWYDLQGLRNQTQFITIFDTTNNVFRDEDLQRLGTLSSVMGFPADQGSIRATLSA